MIEPLQANKWRWDQSTIEHEDTPFYNLAGFKTGKDRLLSIELYELVNVDGQTFQQLKCHFRPDKLAWA